MIPTLGLKVGHDSHQMKSPSAPNSLSRQGDKCAKKGGNTSYLLSWRSWRFFDPVGHFEKLRLLKLAHYR
jgi:hypothetical protein